MIYLMNSAVMPAARGHRSLPRKNVPHMIALTTAQAAAFLGLSERQVQHLAARGQIPGAKKFGRVGRDEWRFPAKPKVLRPKRGRPVRTQGG